METEENILIDTFNFYLNLYNYLNKRGTYDIAELMRIDLLNAKAAIQKQKFAKAIEYLIALYEIADEHELIDDSKIQYPGPGKFGSLVY